MALTNDPNNNLPIVYQAVKALKPQAPLSVQVDQESPPVYNSGDTVAINRDNVATPAFKNASNLKEILFANTKIDLASLRKEAASDDPKISSQANKTLKSVSEYSYYQYHEAQGADGFIYVAGRGMEPYSNDGVKYPKQEEVQELANKELTQYLLVSQIPSADNLLKAMQATGKSLTPSQQEEVARALEAEARNMKPEEVAKIKGQLSDAYTSLIPDYPEHDALKKNVKGLIDHLNKLPKSELDQTWFSAIYGNQETFRDLTDTQSKLERQLVGKTNIFYMEEEPALT